MRAVHPMILVAVSAAVDGPAALRELQTTTTTASTTTLAAAPECPDASWAAVGDSRHCVKVLAEGSFSQCEAACKVFDAQLACVSATVQLAVQQQLTIASPVWIGMYRTEVGQNEWSWVTGCDSDFTRWSLQDYPTDGSASGEHCAELDPGVGHEWREAPCAKLNECLCVHDSQQANGGGGAVEFPNECKGAKPPCYETVATDATLEECTSACRDAGAALPCIGSDANREALAAAIGASSAWLALQRDAGSATWDWAAHSACSSTVRSWDKGEPRSDSHECAVQYSPSKAWAGQACDARSECVCEFGRGQVPEPTEATTAAVTTAVPTLPAECAGATPCYRPTGSGSVSVSMCAAECMAAGGALPCLRSDWDKERLKAAVPDGTFWLGYTRTAPGGPWSWSGHSDCPNSFEAWRSGEPNNSGGQESCADAAHDLQWNDLPCSASAQCACEFGRGVVPDEFLAHVQMLNGELAPEFPKKCDASSDTLCHEMASYSLGLYQCATTCRNANASLPCITSPEIRELVLSQGVASAWTALVRPPEYPDWVSAGAPNCNDAVHLWGVGEPTGESNQVCVAVSTDNSMYDIWCDGPAGCVCEFGRGPVPEWFFSLNFAAAALPAATAGLVLALAAL